MNQSVQIKSKKVQIAIKDGDTQIGTISFNPDNTGIYTKFVGLIEKLTKGERDIRNLQPNDDEMNLNFDSLEDLENASEMFAKIKQTGAIAQETWDDLCAELDAIFGDGVCHCFTGGDYDPELLSPLIDVVVPYFKKSREQKTDKYRAIQSDVM